MIITKALYKAVFTAVQNEHEFMTRTGSNLFGVPEIAFVYSVWKHIWDVRDQIFTSSGITASWEKDFEGIRRPDLTVLCDGNPILFIEFKIKSTKYDYVSDLTKLANACNRHPQAKFLFCAVVDAVDKDNIAGGRLKIQDFWALQQNKFMAVELEEFQRVAITQNDDKVKVKECVVALWEVSLKDQ